MGIDTDSNIFRNLELLPSGDYFRRQQKGQQEKEINANDPGFFGAVLEGAKTSPIVNAVVDGLNFHSTQERIAQDISDRDVAYDWHDDAVRYNGLYPKELFTGSKSREQTRRLMDDYDREQHRKIAVSRRPFASFLGGAVAFGTDLGALSYVPFIGGLGGRVGMRAASGIKTSGAISSLLNGAVSGSVAAALDIAAVELSRTLVDDRVTLGDTVDRLPEEMLFGMLLGGGIGGAIGGLNGKLPTMTVPKDTICEQIKGGTNFESNATTITPEHVKAYHQRLSSVDPTVTVNDTETFLNVIGGCEINGGETVPSRIKLAKFAVDPTTRAYSSTVGTVRQLAKRLHDNHIVSAATDGTETATRSLDIVVRTHQNELQGKSYMLLKDGYEKLISDKNNYMLTKEEFNQLVGKSLLNNGKLLGDYEQQLKGYIEETAGRYIDTVRRPIEDMYIDMKKMQHGPQLIEQSKNKLSQIEKRIEKLQKQYDVFNEESLESLVEKEINKRIKSDIKRGKISDMKHRKSERDKTIFEKYRSGVEKEVREEFAKRSKQSKALLDEAEKEFTDEQQLLKERTSGRFDSDIDSWRQSNDEGYIHRMYDYAKIMAHPVEFVNDVAGKLVEYEGYSPQMAELVANQLHTDLLVSPTGRKFHHVVTLRGAEKHRTIDIKTEVLENWLNTDAQKMAEGWSKSVLPDYYLMKEIGTYDAATFSDAIQSDINRSVKAGMVLQSEAKSLFDTSISQVQRMIDNIRGISFLPEGSVYSARAWRISSMAKSMASINALGGLVWTGIFDAATMVLNKGVFNILRDDAGTFLKYCFKPSFRKALKGHPDMVALSRWVDVMLDKGINRTLSDYGIPENFETQLTRGLNKASQMQQKLSGAEMIFNSLHITSDYGNMLTIGRVCKKVAKAEALSSTDKHLLNLARLTKDDCFTIAEQIKKYSIQENGAVFFELDRWDDSAAANALKYGVNALTENSLLLPGNEVPNFMKTPIGEVMFQYKKYLTSSVDRCFLPAVSRLSNGEMNILAGAFIMVAMGGFKEVLSRLVSGRDSMTSEEFWAYGIGNSDVLPFIGEWIKESYLGFNSNGMNGAANNTYNWLMNYFVPPAVSQLAKVPKMANGVTKLLYGQDTPTTSELRAIKSSIPYNNLIGFNRLLNNWTRTLSERNNEFKIKVKY